MSYRLADGDAELDLRNRRARVRRKAGAVDAVIWQTTTARLLDGCRGGPVFLTDRRARLELPLGGLDPGSGRARLSHHRAAELFKAATADQPGGPWTLHQLRHSTLTHAAEDGANTSTLLAYPGHTSVASLARYARVSPEALSRGRTTETRRREPVATQLIRSRLYLPDSLRVLRGPVAVDKSTLVLILDELENDGLVRPGPDPADRRAHIIDVIRRQPHPQRRLQRHQAIKDQFLAGLASRLGMLSRARYNISSASPSRLSRTDGHTKAPDAQPQPDHT